MGKDRNINAKIQIPSRSSFYVERQGMPEAKVTVFHAGAGYGKTIYMSEIAHRLGEACAWYQLDVSDNDPVLFLQTLEYAVQRVVPDFSAHRNSGFLDHSQDEGTVTDQFIRELSETLEGPLLFVLDDYQEIENEEIHKLLSELIRHTPPAIRFFFATKGDFPPFLASFLARGEAVLWGQDQLKFTRGEAETLLNRVIGRPVEPDLLDHIYEYTEGWPVGLMFAGLALQNTRKYEDAYSVLRGSQVYEYIAYEVFRKLPYDLQQFLVDTSALDALNPQICDAVTGRANSKNNLDYLVQNNLFVIRLDGQGAWYRYHSIFKDFLTSQLKKERKNEILKKAAQYFMRRGDRELGIQYALRCDDYEMVSLGVARYAEDLMQQGRISLLAQLVQYLESREEKMSTACLHAISRFYAGKGEVEKAEAYLKKAAEKAWQDGQYEAYAKDILELLSMLKKTENLSEQCDFINGVILKFHGKQHTRFCRTMAKRRLEYWIQLGKWPELLAMRERIRDGTSPLFPPSAEASRCVEWLCGSQEEGKLDESFLQDARSFQAYSRVMSDYGFYRYLSQEYLAGRLAEHQDLLQEALSTSSDSLFIHWLQLYRLLLELPKKSVPEARKEAQELEQYRSRQELSWPELLQEDQQRLLALLANPESQEHVLPHLDVFCFGTFRVWTEDGKTLSWRTKKTKELFACLFAARERTLSKDQLMELLWAEGDAKKSSALFDTTVSYLRKTLSNAGCGHALEVKNRQYQLNRKAIRSDLDRFERICQMVQKQEWNQVEKLEPEDLSQLYGTGYMSGEDYLWAITEREHLEQKYLETLYALALHYFQKKQYRSAADTAERALETDPLSTRMAGILIESLKNLGDQGSAKKQYEKYNEIWLDEMGQELTYDKPV